MMSLLLQLASQELLAKRVLSENSVVASFSKLSLCKQLLRCKLIQGCAYTVGHASRVRPSPWSDVPLTVSFPASL